MSVLMPNPSPFGDFCAQCLVRPARGTFFISELSVILIMYSAEKYSDSGLLFKK